MPEPLEITKMRASKTHVAAAAGLALAVLIPINVGGQGSESQDYNRKQLVEAYNAAGQQLFQQFAATPGNIVISPYSIGSAMAMALSGARGETEREMASVLKHRMA